MKKLLLALLAVFTVSGIVFAADPETGIVKANKDFVTVISQGEGSNRQAALEQAALDQAAHTVASVTLAESNLVYTGSELKPAVTVKAKDGSVIDASNYTVNYEKNKDVGTATVTVTGTGAYSGIAEATFKILKKANTLEVTAAKTMQTVKKGKTTAIAAKEVFKTKKNASKGKVTYELASVTKAAKGKITVAKNGKVTVKKGLGKGIYTVKVSATSAATANYEKATVKNITFKVKVK